MDAADPEIFYTLSGFARLLRRPATVGTISGEGVMEGVMAVQLWGMEWPKEVLEVLLVPVALSLVALLWPTWQAWRRQSDFLLLLSRELQEAAPAPVALKEGYIWVQHLDKQFIHQSIMPGGSASDASLLLSLNPNLAYELNQMWAAYSAAKDDTAVEYAQEWCSYLESVCKRLDRRRFIRLRLRCRKLTETVWLPWHCLLEQYYPRKPSDTADRGHHTKGADPGSAACADLWRSRPDGSYDARAEDGHG